MNQQIAENSQSSINRSHPLPSIGHWSFIGKYGLSIIILTFILLSLLYDVTVPFFEKPDELKHFALIQFIQTQHRLPVVEADVYKPWDQEGTQPPLYHILAAVTTSWLDLSEFEEPPRNPHYADDRSFVWRERGNNNLYLHAPGETWRLDPIFIAARLARWLSLLAGVGTLILTHRLAHLIFTNNTHTQPRKSKNARFTKSPPSTLQSPNLPPAQSPIHNSQFLPLPSPSRSHRRHPPISPRQLGHHQRQPERDPGRGDAAPVGPGYQKGPKWSVSNSLSGLLSGPVRFL